MGHVSEVNGRLQTITLLYGDWDARQGHLTQVLTELTEGATDVRMLVHHERVEDLSRQDRTAGLALWEQRPPVIDPAPNGAQEDVVVAGMTVTGTGRELHGWSTWQGSLSAVTMTILSRDVEPPRALRLMTGPEEAEPFARGWRERLARLRDRLVRDEPRDQDKQDDD